MDETRSVFIVPGSGLGQVEIMFVTNGWSIANDISNADLVQFIGGADVNPELYGQHTHKTTQCDIERDNREMEIYVNSLEQGIPMAGICRGGQFLNVMNGGRLYQDVDNHAMAGTHPAFLLGSSKPIDVTSTHHQMMDANWEDDVEVLLTAAQSKRKDSMSNIQYGQYEASSYPPNDRPTDIEALYYPSTNCLCFQPHPEFTRPNAVPTRELYFTLLDRYLFDAIEEKLEQEIS